jgi:hypothetical protein
VIVIVVVVVIDPYLKRCHIIRAQNLRRYNAALQVFMYVVK